MKCKECVHYKLCRDLFCQVDTLTDDDKKCDYFEQKRPHGEWIVRRNKQRAHIYSVCSKCNMPYLDTDFPNFCPNCGADMREGESK